LGSWYLFAGSGNKIWCALRKVLQDWCDRKMADMAVQSRCIYIQLQCWPSSIRWEVVDQDKFVHNLWAIHGVLRTLLRETNIGRMNAVVAIFAVVRNGLGLETCYHC
jgi:hypothetical protein